MALTIGAYLGRARPGTSRSAAVLAVTGVNLRGIGKTAWPTRSWSALALRALGLVASSAGRACGPPPARRARPGPGRAARGRAAVLRLRRVRPDRHAGRGGARPGSGRSRARCRWRSASRSPSTCWSGWPRWSRSAPAGWPPRRAAAGGGDRGRAARPGAGGPGRGHAGRAGLTAGAGRRGLAGPRWRWRGAGTCRRRWPRCTPGTGCRTGPRWRRRCGDRVVLAGDVRGAIGFS